MKKREYNKLVKKYKDDISEIKVLMTKLEKMLVDRQQNLDNLYYTYDLQQDVNVNGIDINNLAAIFGCDTDKFKSLLTHSIKDFTRRK